LSIAANGSGDSAADREGKEGAFTSIGAYLVHLVMQELSLCNSGTELFTDWATGRATGESAFDFTLSVTFCLLQEKPFSNTLGSATGFD